MNALRALALALLVAGLALIGYGIAQGDVRVALLLIIPVVYGTGLAPALGMLCLMAAAVTWFLARVREAAPAADWQEAPPEPPAAGAAPGEPRVRSRSGGVVLLGPIPIVWGSDRKVLPWMVAAGAALLLLALWLSFSWGPR